MYQMLESVKNALKLPLVKRQSEIFVGVGLLSIMLYWCSY